MECSGLPLCTGHHDATVHFSRVEDMRVFEYFNLAIGVHIGFVPFTAAKRFIFFGSLHLPCMKMFCT